MIRTFAVFFTALILSSPSWAEEASCDRAAMDQKISANKPKKAGKACQQAFDKAEKCCLRPAECGIADMTADDVAPTDVKAAGVNQIENSQREQLQKMKENHEAFINKCSDQAKNADKECRSEVQNLKGQVTSANLDPSRQNEFMSEMLGNQTLVRLLPGLQPAVDCAKTAEAKIDEQLGQLPNVDGAPSDVGTNTAKSDDSGSTQVAGKPDSPAGSAADGDANADSGSKKLTGLEESTPSAASDGSKSQDAVAQLKQMQSEEKTPSDYKKWFSQYTPAEKSDILNRISADPQKVITTTEARSGMQMAVASDLSTYTPQTAATGAAPSQDLQDLQMSAAKAQVSPALEGRAFRINTEMAETMGMPSDQRAALQKWDNDVNRVIQANNGDVFDPANTSTSNLMGMKSQLESSTAVSRTVAGFGIGSGAALAAHDVAVKTLETGDTVERAADMGAGGIVGVGKVMEGGAEEVAEVGAKAGAKGLLGAVGAPAMAITGGAGAATVIGENKLGQVNSELASRAASGDGLYSYGNGQNFDWSTHTSSAAQAAQQSGVANEAWSLGGIATGGYQIAREPAAFLTKGVYEVGRTAGEWVGGGNRVSSLYNRVTGWFSSSPSN